MASSNIRAVLEGLKTRLETINATSPYTYDLSGADRVFIGELIRPPQAPAVAVYPMDLISSHGEQLGRYRRQMTVQIQGWVRAETAKPMDRVLNAIDLLDDVVVCIETDRRLGGLIRDLIFGELRVLNGDEHGINGYGVFVTNLQVNWNANSAGGV